MKSNMIHIVFMIIFGIIILLPSGAKATAITMGVLETVGSDLSLDVLRNPALLPLQKSGKSLGFFALVKAVSDDDNNSTANGFSIDMDNTENIEASLFAGYVRNYGDVAWGLALGNVGTGQFAITQDETTAIGYSKMSEKHIINPALFFACGFRVTNNDSVGIQLRAAYSYIDKTEEITKSVSTQETAETNNAMSLLLKLGYLKRLGKTQVGATINSGTLVLERLTGENQYNATSEDYTGDLNVLYISGPAVSIGTFTAFNRFVAMALELKITVPLVYRRDEPNFSDSSSTIKETEMRYVLYTAAAVKGGFEFHLAPYLVFNCGAGVQNSSINFYTGANTSPVTAKRYFMIFMATAGFDYYFAPNTALVCGMVYTYVDGNLSQRNSGTGDAVSIDITVHSLDAFFGFNYGW